MVKKLLKISFLFLAFFVFSCSSTKDDPLIIPPNFAEMPDLNNPEKPSVENKEENVARLKELLLKSD
jgi:hypothetical protein